MLHLILNRAKGFSVIELMVVVAIISILVAVGVPSFINYRNRSRVAAVLAESSSILASFGAYASDHKDKNFPEIGLFNDTISLINFLNSYGGNFSHSNPGFTYSKYRVKNSPTDSYFELEIQVDGVPPNFPGKTITITPKGVSTGSDGASVP